MVDNLANELRAHVTSIEECNYDTPAGFCFNLNRLADKIEQRHFKGIENQDTLTILDVMAHYENEFVEAHNAVYVENQEKREVLANEIVDTCERLMRQIQDYRKL